MYVKHKVFQLNSICHNIEGYILKSLKILYGTYLQEQATYYLIILTKTLFVLVKWSWN